MYVKSNLVKITAGSQVQFKKGFRVERGHFIHVYNALFIEKIIILR